METTGLPMAQFAQAFSFSGAISWYPASRSASTFAYETDMFWAKVYTRRAHRITAATNTQNWNAADNQPGFTQVVA
jgi:hypothetical protein